MSKNELPLVSVHLPTYNRKNYLVLALESVLNQTYKNIEICIGDNASTDGTSEILKSYVDKYPEKIKLIINKENFGFAKNCNIILEQCRGEYIVFFHDDDLMEPSKIKMQVEFMKKNLQCVLCYHDVVYINDSGEKLGNAFSHHFPRAGKLEVLLKNRPFYTTPSMMARSKNLPKNGFRIEFPRWSDHLMWIDTLDLGGDIDYIDQILGSYRIHGSNACIISDNENLAEYLSMWAFCIGKYPQFCSVFKKRMSEALRSARNIGTSQKYIHYLLAGNSLSFSLKCSFGILAYYLSFGKLRFEIKKK